MPSKKDRQKESALELEYRKHFQPMPNDYLQSLQQAKRFRRKGRTIRTFVTYGAYEKPI